MGQSGAGITPRRAFCGPSVRCRAGEHRLHDFKDFRTENGSSKVQDLAVTGLFVLSWVDSGALRMSTFAILSDTMYPSISFRNSTRPKKRQLDILTSDSKQ